MSDRSYLDTVIMSTNYIMQGFAQGRIADGTACGLKRLDDGRWQAHLRGVYIELPQATWEGAKDQLEHKLAGEGLWLRLR